MMTEWQPSAGIEATDELMEIILCDGHISVLAGAGAGKTELLAQKADYLLQTGKCMWPKKILCLSYKKEAQENIKERVMSRCGSKGERFDSYTFDAFCKSIVDRFKDVLPDSKRPSNSYDLVFDNKESNGRDKVSFDLIRYLALVIFKEREDISDLFSMTYSHVFIDEFQDTRTDQYELIKLLFKNKGSSLLSVGDINQSIMLWAGAKRTVFDDYIKDFNAIKKLLVKNFRASDEIQEVLRCFIHYVQNDTNFSPIAKDINNCTIHFYNDEISEAEDLSDIIKGLIESGFSENEICVLTKQQSEKYTEQLRHSLTKKNIRNLEMSELQDLLKEPLGELFSACFKLYTSRSLSGYTDLCQLYLGMYRISSGDAKEELLIKSLSNEIARHRAELGNQPNADSLLKCIKETVEFFCIDRIKGRWGQYKSAGYWVKVWNGLEQHLRYTISSTVSLNDAVQLFGADNSVQVMNIHKCKGLEYKVVILLGLEDQAFWTYHSQKFENDCALYVALSRAKEKVIISTANFRSHRINSRYDNRTSLYNMLNPVYEFLKTHCKFKVVT